ncbi:MAG: fasciclin domain-containing protein [bacterium]|nr:fasciclin domain-containing protein [bacterium]
MKRRILPLKAIFSAAVLSMMTFGVSAQTNVFDDVIVPSPNHTSLEQAIITANLQGALQDPNASLTVWAPDDQAFDDLATALGTNVAGLLALPNLDQILLYHVLGTTNNAASLSNGQIETPLNNANTIKITVTGTGDVFANHAQVNAADLTADNGVVHSMDAVILPGETVADIAIDNGFSTLVTAVATAELLPAVTDPFATLTVFAPDNAAFDDLATTLGVTVNDLLALPNLQDILLYHVLGTEVDAASVQNGGVVTALSPTNTLKTTVTGAGDVFVNQAQVVLTDLTADNGLVHTLDAVVLPVETVADIAIDNGFSTLVEAVATAELLPAVTDPFATLTVFAPDNTAFDNAAADLGITTNDLLALPNLQDILLYHVLGSEVDAASVQDGGIVTALSPTNTIKTTVTGGGAVFINQAEVQLADLNADNGIVHTLNEVILPNETVVDAAIDNGFTTLTAAVIEAELLPALSDPYTEYTVFAPTDQAFDDYVAAAGITLNDLLAAPNLADVLLYHTLGAEVLSGDLTAGNVTTLEGNDVLVNLTGGVFINDAEVTMADVDVDNGVVHVINKVLDPATASLDENTIDVNLYPNPATEFITVAADKEIETIQVVSMNGAVLKTINATGEKMNINVSDLASGQYLLVVNTSLGASQSAFNVK